jgi:hypothetical protein
MQSDATGIMRRLLKFPPVEDVGILVSMACAYKERVLSGKGVTVPQLLLETGEEDPLRGKNEPKQAAVLINTQKPKPRVNVKIEAVIGILEEQMKM